MSTINQDLQASYQIISLLERSKANSESIIDTLPDIFVVLTDEGQILKGNHEASRRMGVGVEELLGMSISQLFTQETWHLFKIYLKQASDSGSGGKTIEFELPVDGRSGDERICYWTIAPLETRQTSRARLFCLIGRDITLLRAYQKQLADIFASIPLSIFTVDRDGKIEETFSAYTQWLLGSDEIAGRTLRDLIYEPSQDYMDAATREGWINLLNYANFTLREFDMLSETFPKQFFYPLPGTDGTQGRYLGIKAQSIAHGTNVNGLLVIIEDRTALVEAEKADEKQKLLQDMSLERALQIKKCDPELLSVVMNDLKALFSQLGDATFSKNAESFVNILHSIKGNARLASFTSLMKMTHTLESRLRDSEGGFDWKIVHAQIDEIRGEWKEILSLARIMKKDATDEAGRAEDETGEDATSGSAAPGKSLLRLFREIEGLVESHLSPEGKAQLEQLENRIEAISCKPLTQLENPLRLLTQSTANELGKKVKLTFHWEKDLVIDEGVLSEIRTCLMHLITNSIDHGLEAPEKRLEARKPSNGHIRIDAYSAGERIVFSVEDDGRGFDLGAILAAAEKKGILAQKDAVKLSQEETLQLLFHSGFSTASQVTEISGRGVGLDAVREIVRKLGGEIEAAPGKSGGASFKFFIKETLWRKSS